MFECGKGYTLVAVSALIQDITRRDHNAKYIIINVAKDARRTSASEA